MGYENVDPATLQTLIGSPPVATSGGSAVATSGFGTLGQQHFVDSAPPQTIPVYGAEDPTGPQPTWFAQLMESFTQNLGSFNFTSAIADVREIQHHLSMGFDHWQRFVSGTVS